MTTISHGAENNVVKLRDVKLNQDDRTDREILWEIRESQLQTEKLVTEFIENMSKNPMMRMMAGKMGLG